MDLLVPTLSNSASLEEYIRLLDDKEIQSWKSQDWNALYKILNDALKTPAFVAEIKQFYEDKIKGDIAKFQKEKEQIEEKLLKFEEMKKKSAEKEFQKDCEISSQRLIEEINQKQKVIEDKEALLNIVDSKTNETELDKAIKSRADLRNQYLSKKHPEIFHKLYSNYRLDPEIKSYMIKIGKEIGQILAQDEKMETSAIALNIGMRQKYAEKISSVIFSYFFPYVAVEDAKDAQHKVIVKPIDGRGITDSSTINIHDITKEYFFGVICHESLHAYGQTNKKFSAIIWQDFGILPKGYCKKGKQYATSNVKNFFQLLRWNGKHFYFNSGSGKNSDIPVQAYEHQPVEKHATFISRIIEHTYRGLTKQYSERNSVDLYNYYTKYILGEPIETKHNGDAVTHKYKMTSDLNLERVEDVFGTLDPLLKKEMNIRQEEGFVLYDVPETWSSRCKFKAFLIKMGTQKGKEARAHIVAQEIARRKAKNK